MVGDGGIEASVDSIFLDVTDNAFVRVVFLVFSSIGENLKAHNLNQSRNFLFVHGPTSILQLQVDPSVAVVFVFMPNGENFIFQGLVFVFFAPLFLPVHKGGFWKVDGGKNLGQLELFSEFGDDPRLLFIVSSLSKLLNCSQNIF